MSAFGRKTGVGGMKPGARPSFGVAKPMKGGGPAPRECLGRMENMILMGDIKIPKEAISRQIAESVDLIVQVKRLRDGSRRTTNVTEVIGMEGDVIVTQELFNFEYLDESDDGKILGEFRSSGLRPYTLEKARQFGFDQAYLEACL